MGAGLNIESLLWMEESEITLFFLPELVLLQTKKLLYINQMRVNVLTVPVRDMRLLS